MSAYDPTVARLAADLLAGVLFRPGHDGRPWWDHDGPPPNAVKSAVRLARAIVAEVRRTEPAAETPTPENPRMTLNVQTKA